MKSYFKINKEIAKVMVAKLNGKQKEIYDELCDRLEFDRQEPDAILAYWAQNIFDGVYCGDTPVDYFSNDDLRYMYEKCCPLDKDNVPWLNAWREILEKTRGENNRADMIDIGVYGLRREDYFRHLGFDGGGVGIPSYMELVNSPYEDYAELLGLECTDVESAFRRLRDCKLFELQKWDSVPVFIPKGVTL